MNTRRLHTSLLATALALGATGAALAQDALTAPQVRTQLESQGYTKVKDLEFKDGMWKAEATSANGKDVDVRLDPRTGRVYPEKAVSPLGEADIRAQLSAAGYRDVDEVKFKDGLWKAEGRTADGEKVNLRLDPDTGELITAERD